MSALHLLYSFPLRIGRPGIGMIAWHQVAGLAELGVQITLYCGSCERPIPGVRRVVETMRWGGLQIPYRMIGKWRALQCHDYLVARALRQMPRKAHVVHCWPLGSLRTLRAAQARGIPTVLERPNTHTAFAYEVVAREHARLGLPVPTAYSHAFDAVKLAREEEEYAAATRLACPSPFVAQTFLDRGWAEGRLVGHQYGYDPAAFRPPSTYTPLPHRPFTAAFVGRCEPRKGLHYALRAWHEAGLSTAGRFLICGDYLPGYRHLLAPWLNTSSIQELGFVSNVAEVMRQCDVLILPSIEEGSALVTYEARGCGMVLLVSDASGARCTHLVDGLVHPAGDANALCRHLKMVGTDAAFLARLRAVSLTGLHELTWARAASRLLGIYEDLSGPASAAPCDQTHAVV